MISSRPIGLPSLLKANFDAAVFENQVADDHPAALSVLQVVFLLQLVSLGALCGDVVVIFLLQSR